MVVYMSRNEIVFRHKPHAMARAFDVNNNLDDYLNELRLGSTVSKKDFESFREYMDSRMGKQEGLFEIVMKETRKEIKKLRGRRIIFVQPSIPTLANSQTGIPPKTTSDFLNPNNLLMKRLEDHLQDKPDTFGEGVVLFPMTLPFAPVIMDGLGVEYLFKDLYAQISVGNEQQRIEQLRRNFGNNEYQPLFRHSNALYNAKLVKQIIQNRDNALREIAELTFRKHSPALWNEWMNKKHPLEKRGITPTETDREIFALEKYFSVLATYNKAVLRFCLQETLLDLGIMSEDMTKPDSAKTPFKIHTSKTSYTYDLMFKILRNSYYIQSYLTERERIMLESGFCTLKTIEVIDELLLIGGAKGPIGVTKKREVESVASNASVGRLLGYIVTHNILRKETIAKKEPSNNPVDEKKVENEQKEKTEQLELIIGKASQRITSKIGTCPRNIFLECATTNLCDAGDCTAKRIAREFSEEEISELEQDCLENSYRIPGEMGLIYHKLLQEGITLLSLDELTLGGEVIREQSPSRVFISKINGLGLLRSRLNHRKSDYHASNLGDKCEIQRFFRQHQRELGIDVDLGIPGRVGTLAHRILLKFPITRERGKHIYLPFETLRDLEIRIGLENQSEEHNQEAYENSNGEKFESCEITVNIELGGKIVGSRIDNVCEIIEHDGTKALMIFDHKRTRGNQYAPFKQHRLQLSVMALGIQDLIREGEIYRLNFKGEEERVTDEYEHIYLTLTYRGGGNGSMKSQELRAIRVTPRKKYPLEELATQIDLINMGQERIRTVKGFDEEKIESEKRHKCEKCDYTIPCSQYQKIRNKLFS